MSRFLKIMSLLIIASLITSVGVVNAQESQSDVIRPIEISENVQKPGVSNVFISLNKRYSKFKDNEGGLIMEIKHSDDIEVDVIDSGENSHYNEEENKILTTSVEDEWDVKLKAEGSEGEINIKITDGENVQSTRINLAFKESLRNVVDSNNNYMIDDNEILRVINAWKNNEKLGGNEVNSKDVLRLVEYWANNTNFLPAYPTDQ